MTVGRWATLAAEAKEGTAACRDEVLEHLRRLVELETPSGDRQSLERAADHLADWFAPLGRISRVGTAGQAPHLLIEHGAANGGSPLVLCHYDTVWPVGTTESWPFRIEGHRVSGPGVLDMKGGIVMAWYALAGLDALAPAHGGWRLLITADEETFNESSRELIAGQARGASAALVLEPPLPDGRLKTMRKGHALVRVEAHGRAAHAGVHPELGVSAAHELARAADLAVRLAAPDRGTTINLGRMEAGTLPNIVAEHGAMELEVRAESHEEMMRVLDALGALEPRDPRAELTVEIDVDRPPMPRIASTAQLFELASELGRAVGLALAEGATGGVSEGNLTSAVGTPTLDGLGVRGAGPHTREEYVDLASFPAQVGLLAGLVGATARTR